MDLSRTGLVHTNSDTVRPDTLQHPQKRRQANLAGIFEVTRGITWGFV